MKRGPWAPPTSLGRKQAEKAIHITLERKDDPEGGAENDRKPFPVRTEPYSGHTPCAPGQAELIGFQNSYRSGSEI